MKLIAEAGASKIQWGIVNKNTVYEFSTSGFNPNVSDRNYLRQLLVSGFPNSFLPSQIKQIQYFGAGCGIDKNKQEVNRALKNFFINAANIEILTDLEAAGKALFGSKSGYVGIMGTGSAFGYFNNGNIQYQAPSLGYLLGDEGSGAHFGKMLISNLILNEFNDELTQLFYNEFSIDSKQLISYLYKNKRPNTYLVSFTPFIKKHISNVELKELVESSLNQFIEKYVLPTIKENGKGKIGLIGGIAFHFQEIIFSLFEKYKLEKPLIIEKPFFKLINLSSK